MKKIIPYLGIALGSFIFGFGLNYFIVANGLGEGGFTGISLVIHYLTGYSIGLIMLILNLPLLFIGWKRWGKTFVFKTLLGVLAVSLAVDLTQGMSMKNNDLLLGALYGGVFSGVGIGLVLRSGATTGGVDIIARLIHEKTGISMGNVFFSFDFFVLTTIAFLFGSDKALYTLVTVYVFSKIVDRIVEGPDDTRAVIIITEISQVITSSIIKEIDRGATILKGYGAYTGQNKDILYVVMSKHELLRLKKQIRNIDPLAFIIVSNVHEVLGEGFLPKK
ncbi:MAG: YitT family protein [Clostridia bacterium]|nr:YitT family protein [Clostridia bacterium]MDD4048004.1 YitT family protein [Clostridia bacterium]